MTKLKIAGWLRRIARALEKSATPKPAEGGRPHASSSMAAFLEALEGIAEIHSEIFDTDVRERMWQVVYQTLITQTTPIDVPDDLGMFSAEANAQLKLVLTEGLRKLVDVFDALGLDTEIKRRRSFLNPKLRTERGHSVEDFFGSP
jgi:hypothetical protein